jgi:hypothetical protein
MYFCVSAMFEYTEEENGYIYEWIFTLIFESNVKKLCLYVDVASFLTGTGISAFMKLQLKWNISSTH